MKKNLRYALLCCMCVLCQHAYTQNEFITIWNTNNPGDSDTNQIIISTWTGFLFDIHWEEVGNPSNTGYQMADFFLTTVTFPHAGIYRVKISPGTGEFSEIKTDDGGDRFKLIDIEQWGNIQWSSMFSAFAACENLTALSATDIPDLSNLNTLAYMFSTCKQLTHVPNLENWDVSNITQLAGMFQSTDHFNQNIGNWDVSNVTDMTAMFYEARAFNQDIGNWDVSNVTSIWSMFSGADVFNQDIGDWDVSNVVFMESTFFEAHAFNQDIGNWDVSNVTSMGEMFWSAYAFNQDISGWDVSNVTDMRSMFSSAYAFNQDISEWQVNNVLSMEFMFLGASAFNQDLSAWDVSKVRSMEGMFLGANLFNADISGWDVRNVVNMSQMFADHPLFDRDLGGWNVSQVADMSSMFEGATAFNHALGGWQLRPGVNLVNMLNGSGLDCINYSRTLQGWAGNPATPDDRILGADALMSGTEALPFRNVLISKGWSIDDDGEDDMCSFSTEEFITVWQTNLTGISGNNQITIPAAGSGFTIQWEHTGNPLINGSLTGNGSTTITFPQPGTYRVSVSGGTFSALNFNNAGDRFKLLFIEQWGMIPWSTMDNAFHGCENLRVTAVDIPDLNAVGSFHNMFRNCENLSAVPNMNAWDVSTVTDMGGMFANTGRFQQVISLWDVSNVEYMDSMFYEAEIFNTDISDWNTESVTDMRAMFSLTFAFDQDLSGWNTSAVTNMQYMFFNALGFNRRLGAWDLSSLDAGAFPMQGMFSHSGMDCNAYSFTLIGWFQNGTAPPNIDLDAEYLFYSPEAVFARNGLIADGWTIVDEGADANCELYSDKFITIWQTNIPGNSANNQVRIPASGTNFSIYWEEVSNTSVNGTLTSSGETTITFPYAGTYRVKIFPGTGTFNRINFGNLVEGAPKLIEIERWGTIPWNSFQNAFYNCVNLTVTATDTAIMSAVANTSGMFQDCRSLTTVPSLHAWTMSTVVTMSAMFYGATNFNHPIGTWNTLNVTNMAGMFYEALAFNQPIGTWNTAKVTNMSNMFYGANAFNQNLNSWNTGLVTNMMSMFQGASSFNQNLNSWNVSKVTNMSQMFLGAIAFNGNISAWNTVLVTTMSGMFQNAVAFNQPIGNWNTGNVTTMFGTFNGATSFNQPIGNWNTVKVTSMFVMFQHAVSFNQPIGNWNTANVVAMNSMFNGAKAFNQPIGNWNVGKVTSMAAMFSDALSFNQDIENWNVRKVTFMTGMFQNAESFNHDLGNWTFAPTVGMLNMLSNSGMDCDNYSETLIGWAANDTIPVNRVLGATGMHYFESAATARDFLVNTQGWTISDGAEVETCPFRSPRLYVDQDAIGNNSGVSWYNAFHDVQDALQTISDHPELREIWIAEGVYKPAVTNRDSAFVMFDSVAIYGGFEGIETAVEERGTDFPVIFSGDIGVLNTDTDNAYHVVVADVTCTNCLLDQLTITDGNANGTGMQDRGAAVLNTGQLSMQGCTIEGNTGLNGGTPVCNTGMGAELLLDACHIRN